MIDFRNKRRENNPRRKPVTEAKLQCQKRKEISLLARQLQAISTKLQCQKRKEISLLARQLQAISTKLQCQKRKEISLLARQLQAISSDVSFSFIERGDFIYPKDTIEEASDDDTEVEEQDISLIHVGKNTDTLKQVGEDEEIIGEEEKDEEEQEGDVDDDGPESVTSRSGLHSQITASEGENSQFYLITKSKLEELAALARRKCKTCGGHLTVSANAGRGSSGHITWACNAGHRTSWCTQETVHGTHVGDMKLASAIILSGNNFGKIKLLSKFLPIQIMAKNTFYALQRRYIAPAIEDHWQRVQSATRDKHRGGPVVVCGDARNDSPGHSAQYSTYTFVEHDSQDVLHVGFLDKRNVQMKSPNMEAEGFKRGLEEMEADGLNINEVVTDAHPAIAKHMRVKRPDIFHSWDVWHGAKNLGKKLTKAAAKSATRKLLFWVRHILLHFWFCSRTCGGDQQMFKAKWHGMTHHVTNRHEWVAGLGGSNQCEHETVTEPDREEWLQAGDSAHRALVEVAYERRFLCNMIYFTRFRHTSMLESIHNHILMYASKRFSFDHQAYRARNLLAMIDFMAHKDRPAQTDKEGKTKYVATWSKHAGNYVAKPVKVPKTYSYIPCIMSDILHRREIDKTPLFAKATLLPDDPRNVQPRLAPFPPPPIEEILQRKMGRRGKDN
ncbi:uncharacterized protein [Diadema antillarum]|uniref:uncharacterized protein n=1 Tax=Diadema antillarum TaxID=105358 RepID=UPI003A8A4A83